MSSEDLCLAHLLRLARDGRPHAVRKISMARVKGIRYEQSFKLMYWARKERFMALSNGWAAVVAEAATLMSGPAPSPNAPGHSDGWQLIREFASVSLASLALIPFTLMIPFSSETAGATSIIYFLCATEIDEDICAMVQAEVHPDDARLVAAQASSTTPDATRDEVLFVSHVTFCPREKFDPYVPPPETREPSMAINWPNIRCRTSRVSKSMCTGMQFVPLDFLPSWPRERLQDYTARYFVGNAQGSLSKPSAPPARQ